MFDVLEEYSMAREEPIVNVVNGIIQHPEMEIIAMMMSDNDKTSNYNKISKTVLLFVC